ncbi:MAG: hypothetical protein EXQ56_13340 [Acidobacteria bacterium]|nr:hypothetical protein [Acidobacteriota bacterium]
MTHKWNAGLWLQQIIAVLLCLESGVVLLVLPWSVLWDRNLWVFGSELLRPFLMNHYLRGAVSGVGLLTLWVGVTVAADLLRAEPVHADAVGADQVSKDEGSARGPLDS